MRIPPANHGYLLAIGAGVLPAEQMALFGQVDVAASVLDVLGLSRAGLGGASVFRRLSAGRTLLGADAYKKAIYAISEQAVLRCDQALRCFDADGAAIDAAGIRELLARNELRRVGDSPYLASMPARDYPSDRVNMLLGRYLTHLPRGQGMVLRVSADNSGGAARLFRLLLWDCMGRYGQQDAARGGDAGPSFRFRGPVLCAASVRDPVPAFAGVAFAWEGRGAGRGRVALA